MSSTTTKPCAIRCNGCWKARTTGCAASIRPNPSSVRYDPREVACLIVDIRMGGMTGLELQDRLIERRSPLPIVFITGHGDVPMAVNTMKKGAMDFIQKPFKEDELVRPGGAHARSGARRLLPTTSRRPAATPCCPS
jgi:DNA-binding NtrC family response regulator